MKPSFVLPDPAATRRRSSRLAPRPGHPRYLFYGLLAGMLATGLLAGLLGRTLYGRRRVTRRLRAQNTRLARQRDTLALTLAELQRTQLQLVQTAKLVALASLTAGLAHELLNPLNFVKNFAEVSLELVTELEQEQQLLARDGLLETELLDELKQNLDLIHAHGARAGGLIQGLLTHARRPVGERQAVDLNALAQEYLRLAYEELQIKYPGFGVSCRLEEDATLGLLWLVPQELGRVLLNLYANALYAVHQQSRLLGPPYAPEVRVRTSQGAGQVELRVRDNGAGIPAALREQIFQPFFTTKPAGEGSGLGLSLSHDIITHSYGGTLSVQSQEGAYAEFTLALPLTRPPLVLERDPG
ncbi:sensor histidine kinase [Hymenobacter sp. HD11105]